MQINRIVVLASALLALAACQQQSAPSSSQAGGGTSAQSVAAKSSPAITIDPSTMTNCDSIAATVTWDAKKAGVDTDSTEIWVGSSDSDTKLFSAGGNAGETKTGPWVSPGTHFLLKNKADGKVVGEAVVGGPACQQKAG